MMIRECVEQLVNEHIEIWDHLKDDPVLKERAKNIALYDLFVQREIYDKAYLQVTALIESEESG